MSSTLSMSSGDRVALSDLQDIPMPPSSVTYQPISHYDLAERVLMIATDILHDFEFHQEQFGIARDGAQMFGVLTFRGGSDEMGLSIGLRNSLDKSLAVGLSLGSSVFVCDNLCFSGDITTFRKHTANIGDELDRLILSTLYSHRKNYLQIQGDAYSMKHQKLDDEDAFRWMGLLYGKGVITPRQLQVVKREWLEPSYEAFGERNKWSLYNAVTEGLKSAPPHKIMERHIQLHQLLAS